MNQRTYRPNCRRHRHRDHYRAVIVARANDAAVTHLHPDRATLVIAGTEPGGVEP